MVGIAIALRARVSQISAAWTAMSNTSIGTIAPHVTAAVFTVLAVLVLMAAWFAKAVHKVTKKSWRVLAVIILQATSWVWD
jgi:hypothetical protein